MRAIQADAVRSTKTARVIDYTARSGHMRTLRTSSKRRYFVVDEDRFQWDSGIVKRTDNFGTACYAARHTGFGATVIDTRVPVNMIPAVGWAYE